MVGIFPLLMKTVSENVNTHKKVGQTTPRSPAHLYKKNIVRAVNLREVLLVKLANAKLAMRLPPITEPLRKILPNGIAVIVEHYRDQTARLILPQFSNRCYWLATRKGKPSDLYLKDHLGNKVRNLFYDTKTGILGSRHELQKQGIYIYASRDLTPAKRQQRWADILKDEYPTKAGTILANPHNIPLALKHRPKQTSLRGGKGWKHKKTWIAIVERAWWGYVRKGEGEQLQSAILASITEHLWKPKRKKRGRPHNFWKTLFPLNALRQKMKRRHQELEIEPPLPKWTRG